MLLQTATSAAQGSAATEAAAALAGPVANVAKAQVSFHGNKICKLGIKIARFQRRAVLKHVLKSNDRSWFAG